jgi:hypothetical protein
MVATGSRASFNSVGEAAGKGESTARVVTSGFFLDGINFGSVNPYRYIIKSAKTLPSTLSEPTAPSALKAVACSSSAAFAPFFAPSA